MNKNLKKTMAVLFFFELQNLFFYMFYKFGRIQFRHVFYYAVLSHILLGLICYITVTKKEKHRLLLGLLYALMTAANFFMYGMVFGNLSARNINNVAYLVNHLYFLCLVLVCQVLWKGRKSICLGAGLVGFLALFNYHVYCFRGNVLNLSDIYSIRTAWNVRSHYHILINRETILFMAGLACAAVVFSYGSQKLKAGESLYHRWLMVPFMVLVLWIVHSGPFLRAVRVNAIYYEAGNNNGYYYNTVLKYLEGRYAMKHPPEGYDSGVLEEDLSKYETGEEFSGTKPNVVVIMNESFADFSVINDHIGFSQNVTENLQWIREESVWGNVYVSVFGGNTANSEYEFLTNDSMIYYPEGSVPYSAYIREPIEALPVYFNQLGYFTCAMHPYKASGWNRPSVYRYMGFQEMFFEEEFEGSEYIRDYVSDASDYEKVYELLEKQNEPVFCFNVTMQNHGGYEVVEDFDGKISVDGFQDEGIEEAETFLALIQESDRAIGEFLEHLKDFSEPTVVVFFGDHQPGVEDEFYEYLYGKTLQELSQEEKIKQYATPFFIWSNTGVENRQISQISLNYLSMVMLKETGLSLTPYQLFLEKELYPEYPVITTMGVIDFNGEIRRREEIDNELLLKYEQLIHHHIMEPKQITNCIFSFHHSGGHT